MKYRFWLEERGDSDELLAEACSQVEADGPMHALMLVNATLTSGWWVVRSEEVSPDYVGGYTKISYSIITDYDKGVMSEPFPERGVDLDDPDHEHIWVADGESPLDNGQKCSVPDCTYRRYDMSTMGPHPFTSGYPTLESTADTVARAREWVASLGTGRVWVEKVTETIKREKINV